ncbi:metal-dependent hydrolase [Lysinibacillus alkalisoli]|uniref:Metal-dependent hydrolase n=1 Tax=Lysinibacillus alkalisoli TaxID=1911548 RepID=A0A917LI99_9BACI|nr:MBL fold metallo-hydrolase [Lysinibacillus alkalisoli]GGG26351.1 metal-dependent hydrolase [Lysinibacillus alkalisoli]
MELVELLIKFEFNGQENWISPILIVQGEGLILVDAGYANFLPFIEVAIQEASYDTTQLQHIIITHYDDHIGSLYALKEKYPHVTIIVSAIEAPSISGAQPSERLIQAQEILAHMPKEQKDFGEWFVQQLQSLEYVRVDKTVNHLDLILQDACQVIATPGHTAGHISLFFPALNSIITGDAAVHEAGQLTVANLQFGLDLKTAEQSLQTVKNLQAKVYYCYHGGRYEV